jgi:3-oxoacyl-[acyl-carrier protein] reductase
MIDLSGKTAVVTGGSRGIGRACALILAQAGADVAIGYQSQDEAAESTVSEIQRLGKGGIAVQGNVAEQESVESLLEAARRSLGPVEIAVANAGIWKEAAADRMTELEWNETLDINLKSAFLLCREVIPEMKERGEGSIILIGSTAGQRGEAFHSHYAASKGALMAFAKSVAGEVGPCGIRINCVAPGWVRTDMCQDVFSDSDFEEEVRQGIPMRRIPGPEDIAGPVLFLASDLSRHVQGEVLNVNGGSVLCG